MTKEFKYIFSANPAELEIGYEWFARRRFDGSFIIAHSCLKRSSSEDILDHNGTPCPNCGQLPPDIFILGMKIGKERMP